MPYALLSGRRKVGQDFFEPFVVDRLGQVAVKARVFGPPAILVLSPAGLRERTIWAPHGCFESPATS